MGTGTRIGLFLLRVYVGVTFVLAAWGKIWPEFSFGNFGKGWLKQPTLQGILEGALKTMRPEVAFYHGLVENVFLPHAGPLTYLVVFGELLVGIALVLGLLTRISAAAGMFMTAMFFLLTWQAGPLVQTAMGHHAFVYLVLCLVILISGAGLYGGIDGQIRKGR